MPILAVLNQKGGVGKTTLSIHIATALAAGAEEERHKVLLIDADSQGSALDWAAQRTAPARFPVIGLPKATLHREVPVLAQGYEWVVIDGPPRVNEIARSAIAASDMVTIPVQPSPYDVWAAEDIVNIIGECVIHKPDLKSRFLINRLFLKTTLGSEVTDALSAFAIPVLKTAICNRTEYAKSAKFGLTALETDPNSQAAKDVQILVQEIVTVITAPAPKEAIYAS
jgi:chromosome partitioning protein